MKPVLYVGDSHLPRLERACARAHPGTGVFFAAPGPISDLVEFSGGKLIITEDRDYLRQHPRAGAFDFNEWLDRSLKQYRKLEARSGAEVSGYSAVVLVGFGKVLHRGWWDAAMSYHRGEISVQVWERYSSYLLGNTVKGRPVTHVKLLRQLSQTKDAPPIFSVPASLQNVAANKASGPLREGEAISEVLRMVETRIADLLDRRFGVSLVSFPDQLLDKKLIGTTIDYQQREGDFSHLNMEGSRIWFEAIFAQVSAGMRAWQNQDHSSDRLRAASR